MTMYKRIDFNDFRCAFSQIDRNNQFSHKGLRALFDYLEDGDRRECGSELDVVALFCGWTEYESAPGAAEKSGWTADKAASAKANEEAALYWLNKQTITIPFDGGILVKTF